MLPNPTVVASLAAGDPSAYGQLMNAATNGQNALTTSMANAQNLLVTGLVNATNAQNAGEGFPLVEYTLNKRAVDQ